MSIKIIKNLIIAIKTAFLSIAVIFSISAHSVKAEQVKAASAETVPATSQTQQQEPKSAATLAEYGLDAINPDALGLTPEQMISFMQDGNGLANFFNAMSQAQQKAQEANLKKALNILPEDMQKLIATAQAIHKDFAAKILAQNILAELLQKSYKIITENLNSLPEESANSCKTSLDGLNKVCDEITKDTTGKFAQLPGQLGLSIQTMPLQVCPPEEAFKLQKALNEIITVLKQQAKTENDKEKIEELKLLQKILSHYTDCFQSKDDQSGQKHVNEILAELLDYVAPQIEVFDNTIESSIKTLENWKKQIGQQNLFKASELWVDELKSYAKMIKSFTKIKNNANIHGTDYPKNIYKIFALTCDLFSKFYAVQKINNHDFGQNQGFLKTVLKGLPLPIISDLPTSVQELPLFSLQSSCAVLGFLNHQSDGYANLLFQATKGIKDFASLTKSSESSMDNPMASPIMAININAAFMASLNRNANNSSIILTQYLKINPVRTKLVERIIEVGVAWTYYQFECIAKQEKPEAWPKEYAPLNTAAYNLIMELKNQIVSEITYKIKGKASPETLEKIETFTMGLLKPELAQLAINFALQWILVKNYIPGLNSIMTFTPHYVYGPAYTAAGVGGRGIDLEVRNPITRFTHDYGYYIWADKKHFDGIADTLKAELSAANGNETSQKAAAAKYLSALSDPKRNAQSITLYMRYESIKYVLQSLGEFWGRKVGQKYNKPLGKFVSWAFCKISDVDPKEMGQEIQMLKMPVFLVYQMFMSNPAAKPTLATFLMQRGFMPQIENTYDIPQTLIDRGIISWFLHKLSSQRIITPLETAKALKLYDQCEKDPSLIPAKTGAAADEFDASQMMGMLMPQKFNVVLDSITDSLKATLIGRSIGKITGFLASTWPVVSLVDDGITKACDHFKVKPTPIK